MPHIKHKRKEPEAQTFQSTHAPCVYH